MKTIRKDNPHVAKRQGQRKKNRRFSMQAFQRHGNTSSAVAEAISHVFGGNADKHDHDSTKTPEDSTGQYFLVGFRGFFLSMSCRHLGFSR